MLPINPIKARQLKLNETVVVMQFFDVLTIYCFMYLCLYIYVCVFGYYCVSLVKQGVNKPKFIVMAKMKI